jgi:hypothetical protein
MKKILTLLSILILICALNINSNAQNVKDYFIYEIPVKSPISWSGLFIKIVNKDSVEIQSFSVKHRNYKFKKLEMGAVDREKMSYELLENGNLIFGDKTANNKENFKLKYSYTTKGKLFRYKSIYERFFGDDFLNLSNDEKRLRLNKFDDSDLHKFE